MHGDDADDDGADVRASGNAHARWKINNLVLAQQMLQDILENVLKERHHE